MTTGYTELGSPSGDLWFRKSWSGGDATPVLHADGRVSLDRKTPHAYSMHLLSSRRTESTYVGQYGQLNTGYWWPGSGPAYPDGALPYWGPNEELKLLSKLADKIRGHSFSGGVFAAEAPKAIRMIRNSANAVLGAFHALHKLDGEGIIRSLARAVGHAPPVKDDKRGRVWQRALNLGDVSGAWLALQYGWKPLLQDIADGLQMLQSLSNGFPEDNVVKVSHSLLGEYQFNDYGTSCKLHVKHRVKLIVHYKELPSSTMFLGIESPAVVAWELLPYSFVVDWFIPVQEYLENASFFRGFDCQVVRSEKRFVWSSDVKNHDSGTNIYVSGGDYSWKAVDFTRSIQNGVSVPKPQIKDLGHSATRGHMLNAAALIGQLISKSREAVTEYRVHPHARF